MPTRLPLNERLDRAAQIVIRSRIFYDIWFCFENAQACPETLDVMRRFNEFFRFDPHAHLVAFVVHMAALFEKRTDTINLPGLAKEMKAARLIPARDAAEVDTLLGEAEQLARKVAILRNYLFAHRSALVPYAAVFKKAAVTANQLHNLTEMALKIANRLLLARGLTEQFFNPYAREHSEAMLKALKEAFTETR
jgi:hypothetical protein